MYSVLTQGFQKLSRRALEVLMQNWNLSYESAKFRQLSFLSSLHLFIKSLSEKSDMKLWFGEGENEVLL